MDKIDFYSILCILKSDILNRDNVFMFFKQLLLEVGVTINSIDWNCSKSEKSRILFLSKPFGAEVEDIIFDKTYNHKL